jgi:serine/threonine protein kinase
VLLSPEGEVKLTDFGIARPTSGPTYTRTGIVKGKVPYLAPEYARSGRFDARCDLYSLGVLLYECLAGSRPYDGATDLQTLERAARGEHVPLSELAPSAPPAFRQAVEQLIQPDPAMRVQSASELLDLLMGVPSAPRTRRELGRLVASFAKSRVFDDLPTLATDARAGSTEPLAGPAPTDSSSFDVGRRRVGPLMALGIAALTAASALTLSLLRSAPPPDAHAVEPAASNEPPSEADEPLERELVLHGEVATPAGESAQAAPVAEPAHARLEVVVVPYGDVYIDGTLRGTAPITLRLPPGTHSVRTDGPASRRELSIRLRPGERKRVELQ